MLRPTDAIRSIPAYHPPLAGRNGLRLDFNENTVGCSPRVLERLRQITADDLARYPEKQFAEEKMAEFLGVAPSELLLTNGADEAIHLLCQTYLEAGDHALIVVPTYSMYRIYIAAAGAEITSVPASPNFEFPFAEVRHSITERTRFIAVANPNNPTGTLAPVKDLLDLAASAPNTPVLVDEAYFEFCGQTVLARRSECPNVFVARTFSKAYGLAGLRMGALIGDADQMTAVRRVSSPYNVNQIALTCLPVALDDREYVQTYVSEILVSRQRLQDALRTAGISFWPSEANFVLLRVGATREDAQLFTDRMRAHGMLVRDRSADYGCEGCVRITLGPKDHTDRLLSALHETVEELGIAQEARQ
ncbi:MAG: histidinol-phosphate transaminase [Candidatus Sulfotelmatobacter sp.]